MLQLFIADDCTFFWGVYKSFFIDVDADVAGNMVIVQKENNIPGFRVFGQPQRRAHVDNAVGHGEAVPIVKVEYEAAAIEPLRRCTPELIG